MSLPKFFLLALLSLLLTSCQTSPIENFPKIKNGMERSDVLELVGNPTRTDRFDGQEKWVYRFYVDEQAQLKQVTFDQGMKVVSSGDETEEPKRIEEIKADDEKRKAGREKTKQAIKDRRNNPTPSAQVNIPPEPAAKKYPDPYDNFENPNATFKPVKGAE